MLGHENINLLTIIKLIDNCDDYDEDKYIIKCMEEYGINNVRGGSFNQVKLSKENITTINQMLKTYKNLCYICGSEEHFANNYKNNNKIKCELDGKCNCVSSYFLPHRKSKCTLQNTIKYVMKIFDNENDDIDILKEINLSKNSKMNNDDIIKDCNKLKIDDKKDYDKLKIHDKKDNFKSKANVIDVVEKDITKMNVMLKHMLMVIY